MPAAKKRTERFAVTLRTRLRIPDGVIASDYLAAYATEIANQLRADLVSQQCEVESCEPEPKERERFAAGATVAVLVVVHVTCAIGAAVLVEITRSLWNRLRDRRLMAPLAKLEGSEPGTTEAEVDVVSVVEDLAEVSVSEVSSNYHTVGRAHVKVTRITSRVVRRRSGSATVVSRRPRAGKG
jgi:hypothetical protein